MCTRLPNARTSHSALQIMCLHRSRLAARVQPIRRSARRLCAVWSACAQASPACAGCLAWATGGVAWATGGVAWAHACTALVADVEARRVVGRSLIRSEGLRQRAREASLQVSAVCVGQRLWDTMLSLCAWHYSQSTGWRHI